jgi:hypothetical protein
MLELLIRLYRMSMAYDVRSPMPHLVGPPGSGKSWHVEKLAELLEVELHILNVSRLSPLEVEGVQMPHGHGDEMVLRMLPARWWTRLKDGDILLMDEFLRGFPEVYDSLLDVFTSRRVGNFRLPKVFIIGASNSVVAYDPALTDRLMHITVPDPRKRKAERQLIAKMLVRELGLLPQMEKSAEMDNLLDTEVLPTYKVLDSFQKKGTKVVSAPKDSFEGHSVRHLIGQGQLRHVTSPALRELIDNNNLMAINSSKPQYILLLDARAVPSGYVQSARKLRGNPHLTPVQALNLEMNLELLELEAARSQKDEDEEEYW